MNYFVKQTLNVLIVTVIALLILGLIPSTRLLFDFQMTFEYDKLYFSLMLPVELLSLLLIILIIIKDLNFNHAVSKPAISLLLFNCYSFFVISHYFPLFILDGYDYSACYSLAYQIFLSLSAYISLVYGIYYVVQNFKNIDT